MNGKLRDTTILTFEPVCSPDLVWGAHMVVVCSITCNASNIKFFDMRYYLDLSGIGDSYLCFSSR